MPTTSLRLETAWTAARRALVPRLSRRPGHLNLQRKPSEIDDAADELAFTLLRMFGIAKDEAREIAGRPLPAAS